MVAVGKKFVLKNENYSFIINFILRKFLNKLPNYTFVEIFTYM